MVETQSQTSNQTQGNYFQAYDSRMNNPPPVPRPTNSVPKMSFAYEYLMFHNRPNSVSTVCDTNGTHFCILGFTQACSVDKVLIGGLCSFHTQKYFNSIYVGMVNDHKSIGVAAVSLKKCTYQMRFFLVSMMPCGYSESDINSHLMSEGDDGVAKFFQILSNPRSEIIEDNHYKKFVTYCNKLSEAYYNVLNDNFDKYSKLLMPVHVTRGYDLLLNTNAWFQKIKTMAANNEIGSQRDRNGVTKYLIPLTQFCIIDIIRILGYQLDVVVRSAGYAPNCEITDGRYIHGSGTGILNATDAQDGVTEELRYQAYPKDLREALIAQNLHLSMNFDYLIMGCHPTRNYGSNAPPILVTKMHPVEETFDITRIEIKVRY